MINQKNHLKMKVGLTMTYNEIMYPITYFNIIIISITYNGTFSAFLIKIPLKRLIFHLNTNFVFMLHFNLFHLINILFNFFYKNVS